MAPPTKPAATRRDRPFLVRGSIVERWRLREAARLDHAAGVAPWLLSLGLRAADRLGVTREPSDADLASMDLAPERRAAERAGKRHRAPPAATAATRKRR